MFESFSVRRFAASVLFFLATQATAQHVGPQALDTSFGDGGFASIPRYWGADAGGKMLGFVHLPLSGFYMMFSVQTIAGSPKIVASKLTDAGKIDPDWGYFDGTTHFGGIIYSAPMPDGVASGVLADNDARVAVGIERGAEIVYLVYRLASDPTYLGVMRVRPDGSLIDFSASNLPTLFTGGVGMVKGVATGRDGDDFGGIVVAVQGRGGEIDKAALVPVQNGLIVERSSSLLARAGLRINRIVMATGFIDVVGAENGNAMYVQYDPYRFLLGADHQFDLPCTASAGNASVADDIARDFTLGSDVLVIGRSDCSSGGQEMVAARISLIESTPSVAWHLRMADDLGPCINVTVHCWNVQIAMSDTELARAYVTSTFANLVRLAVDTTPARVLGVDAMGGMGAKSYLVVPARKFGSYETSPWLTGLAYDPDTNALGRGRVALDRIFADGFDG